MSQPGRDAMKCSLRCPLSDIDDWDETDGDEQMALIYCEKHKRWSWLWVPRAWHDRER